MRKFLILSLLVHILTTPLWAKDFKILNVINKMDNSKYQLFIQANEDGETQGLKMVSSSTKETEFFPVKNLSTGVVLKQEGKYKVIVIRSDDFLVDRGGHFTIDYLHNGISGKRRSMELKVEFDDQWNIYKDGREVSTLTFIPKYVRIAFIKKAVGIDRVDAK